MEGAMREEATAASKSATRSKLTPWRAPRVRWLAGQVLNSVERKGSLYLKMSHRSLLGSVWRPMARRRLGRQRLMSSYRFLGSAASGRFAPPPLAPTRRVVVTGMGLVSPLGIGVQRSWERLINGDCGIQAIESFDCSFLPSQVAAQVPWGDAEGSFRLEDWVDAKDKRTQDVRFIAYAIAAATEALKDARWHPRTEEEQIRSGVAVGSGMGSLQDIVDVGRLFAEPRQGYRKLSPFFIPRVLINLAAGNISIKFGLKGPNHSCVTACATGAHSIGDAFRFIRHGGGTEASINAVSLAGFCRLKALATKFNANATASSRPFDRHREGFVMGEGAGIIVLEEYEHAKSRGARIYAEVRGYGLSGDAYHITQPEGGGARRAMQAAISTSGLSLSDIDYINAHATSTPLGDKMEAAAIAELFGEHAKDLLVSSTKGAVGHLLGAAGAAEAIFTIKAIEEGIAPPTLNLHNPDTGVELDYVPLESKKRLIRAALSNSFGFGGTNSSLLFSCPPEQ